ncbi:hypothetical protein IV417_07960 [Alphaproteobacteria bacterium KMM 3653]|uniref:Uncharacterized protein n=1 Tax=Harenicola maris TaxID=2841044 RepID=A0AAP2CPM7_9RHOB|nr:hypothetical protein [Harenicola maris]
MSYYITVPLTAAAAERHDRDACIPGDLHEWAPSEEEITELWDTGVMPQINAATGLVIDAFEKEKITGAHLQVALGIVGEMLAGAPDQDALRRFEDLLRLGAEKGTGVYLSL